MVFAVGWWILNRTAFGQGVQAIGGNAPAAELMGLPVRRSTTIVYAISGACAGLAGILTTALSGGGQEARIGDSYELSAIAAVVIGGTLLSGGVGSMVGSLAGVTPPVRYSKPHRPGGEPQLLCSASGVGSVPALVVILQAVVSRRAAPPG